MMLVSVLVAGCGNPVASVRTANQLADGFVDAVGVEPDSREVLERNNNIVNTVADTVTLRWDSVDLGDDPLEALTSALEDAGMTVTRRADEIGEGPQLPAPTPGIPVSPRLQACLDGSNPSAGGLVWVGRVEGGVHVSAEFGGPPASAGCSASAGLPKRSEGENPRPRSPDDGLFWPLPER